MSKVVLISIIIVLILIIGAIFVSRPNAEPSPVQNIETKEGVQYITISANGGYSPNTSEAKAGIPTKLIVKTGNTFDCSSSLVIKSINYRKILKQNSETEIDIGIPTSGEPFYGTCSMGMYNFKINFN